MDVSSNRTTPQGVPQNTVTRIISTMIALPIIFFTLYTGGWLFTLLIALVILVAALELTTIMHEGKTGIITFVSVAYVLATGLSYAYVGGVVWLLIAFGGAGVVFILDLLMPLLERREISRTAVLTVLLFALGHVAGFAMALRNDYAGIFWWLLILFATFAADTLAFAGGRTYGKTPLLPEWSPKKTLEGTITGVVGAIVLGMGALFLFRLVYPPLIFIVVVAPLFAVVGDLMESKFKRIYHVKDSSVMGLNVVPGHGGMLDRIDSLSFVVVFVYLALLFL
jgi:phosphatidate cytidylyltransferase